DPASEDEEVERDDGDEEAPSHRRRHGAPPSGAVGGATGTRMRSRHHANAAPRSTTPQRSSPRPVRVRFSNSSKNRRTMRNVSRRDPRFTQRRDPSCAAANTTIRQNATAMTNPSHF